MRKEYRPHYINFRFSLLFLLSSSPLILCHHYFEYFHLLVPPTVTANVVSINETRGRETTVVSFNITRDSPQVKVEDIRWSFKHIGSEDKMPLNTTCTIVNCSDTRYMRYNFSDDLTTLTISNLQVEDYGDYTLTAGNAAGENSTTVSLTVHGKSMVHYIRYIECKNLLVVKYSKRKQFHSVRRQCRITLS